MEIEEDEEPQWYLLNCVAGLELELLSQCRSKCAGMPDVVKFVVPTVSKTRSHGAKRMVRDVKVKYQGYVFAKLRLREDSYTALQEIDLCRSWMGTINMKGYRKLPPAPLPLNEEEVESFDLENPKWEQDQPEIVAAAPATKEGDQTVILDTEEYEMEEARVLNEIEEEVKNIYKNLKVEDMVKVTANNKFCGEDGVVRRLKEGMVLIRFFTYGTVFDEWLDPSDVRKLTEEEVLKGLSGPSAPITQRDLDESRETTGARSNDFDRRNQVGAFGGESRNRRQDRTERRSRGSRDEEGTERDNWNWYQQNERRSREGGYSDGEEHIRGSADQGPSRRNFWAESDVDSQWGRNKSQRKEREPRQNQQRQQQDDWSSFISESSPPVRRDSPSKQETDDFFSSLMSDLSSDLNDEPSRDSISGNGRDSDDDFFASLMSEISNDHSKSGRAKPSNGGSDGDEDFFASLEKEIRGSTRSNKSAPSNNNRNRESSTRETEAQNQLDDIFAELAMESSEGTSSGLMDDEDDFFASLEAELASDLVQEPTQSKTSVKKRRESSVVESNDNDFFAELETELNADADQSKSLSDMHGSSDGVFVDDDDFFASLQAEIQSETQNEQSESLKSTEGKFKGSSTSEDRGTPPAVRSVFDASSLQERTIPELKELLKQRGLKVSGKKAELIERLTATTSS
jgi:transcription antitermination factor NusG